MAYISAEIKIPEAGCAVPVRLYYPTDLPAEVGNEVKGVITLLHGLGNSPDDWMQYSAAPRYAADNGFVLVAPYAANSFYANMWMGPPWYTILTELLPVQLHRIFKLPTARACNYIAGLSMGGYGAMRIGLSHPERYAAIGSFSGALDMREMARQAMESPQHRPIFEPILGPEGALGDDMDLMELAKRAAALPEAERPRLFTTCGSGDNDVAQIYWQNQNFRKLAESLPLDYQYAEWPGVHEWNVWDRSLAEFIGFIKNDGYGEKKRADWA